MSTIMATWLSTSGYNQSYLADYQGVQTVITIWLSTNERVEDGVLRQRGQEEEDEYNQSYLAEYQ